MNFYNKAFILKAKYSFMYLSNVKNILLDKIKLLLKVLSIFIFIKKNSKLDYDDIIFDPQKDNYTKRGEYVSFFLNNQNSYLSSNYRDILYFKTYGDILRFYMNIVSYFLDILKEFIIFSNFSYSRNINYYINISYINVIKPQRVYFFNYLSIVSYLSAQYIAKNYKDVKVFYIYTSGILYETCRYDSFEKVNIIVGSKLQFDEIKYYQEKKWMKFHNCTLTHWGVDNIKIFETYSKERTVDIGLFSSGEWARPDGFLRGDNIEEIKNYKYIDNAYNKIFEDIVNVLVQDEYSNLKIKVYLHPYEKFLINTHNIYPPFWKKLVNCDNFVLDTDEKPSNFFESKLAIVVFSSITIDRLDYDLDTLFFLPNMKTKEFIGLPSRKIYQSYDKYIYSNHNEFVKKLDKLLHD